MLRKWIVLLLFSLGLLACRFFTVPVSSPTPTAIPASATPTLLPTTTATFVATEMPPTATAIPATATLVASPTPISLAFDIRTHPDGGLYVGDQVSFEVIAPPEMDYNEATLVISDISQDMLDMEAQFAPYGIGGRMQSTFHWTWNTSNLDPGAHPLTFAIQPLGYTWTHTITLGSAAEVPPPEPLAQWSRAETDCCLFYYITDTAAAREITATLSLADQRAEHAIDIFGVDFEAPLTINLMPRVLGQGGFASTEMYISFLDRNYAGNSLDMVLHHEMVHVLDQRLGGDLRPSILVEGLAVYLTGGHYKPENMILRAATLLAPSERDDGLGMGWYLPLKLLADDFYRAQHEIGYIQAGALVEFMVDSWGWDAFSTFYRDIHPADEKTHSAALDAALQAHFNITLDELEADFLAMLKAQEINSDLVDDVRLTVEFFDTMRRYQQILDPSAYFLTAWLPDGPSMRERGIVADLVRHPSDVENLALETLLVAADAATDRGEYGLTIEALKAVNAVLDAIEARQTEPFAAHPLALAHYEIASHMQEIDYLVQQIEVSGEIAQVVANRGWPELTTFEFSLAGGNWVVASGQ